MKYLVTGALGALGAWAVRSLLDRGQDVVTYDLGGSDHRLRLALSDDEVASLTRIDGDVTDLDHLERVIDEHAVTNVIHLAALQVPFVRDDPVLGSKVNVTGMVNLLEAVRRRADRMGPLVYASSIAAVKGDAEYRARCTACSSSPTRVPRPATPTTSASPRSGCARTRSTGPAATRG
jgi:UDP-glucuronate 4-epimerase